jgi:general nucleoside transport system ATP-binding protein
LFICFMIELKDISKRFGAVVALDRVSLEIRPGEILGLLGENGAGKSTLMQILFGLMRPDGGTIRIDGKDTRIGSPRVAQALGIGMVHQHFKLVPTLTALQNFALFVREKPATLREAAERQLTALKWTVPLDLPVASLPVGQQQRVEILKALLTVRGAAEAGKTAHATLILDEPTAVLTPQETAELFAAMRALRDQGAAIVFITHKLGEVQSLCDHVAILRRGKMVHTGPLREISSAEIARRMIGSGTDLPPLQRKDSPGRADGPVLRLQGVCTPQLRDVSLAIRPGEILGIAGVDGNGQSHLVQAVLGTLPPPGITAGRVFIGDRDAATLSTRGRLDRIAFIAEDRQREALVLPLSIEDNLLLKDYRSRPFNTLGWLRFGAWHAQARALISQFDIRARGPAETVGHLSGGNQQKVVVARELHSTQKTIIVAVNPTRGLDIGATAFVLQKLLHARDRSENPAAILLIHSDLDELLSLSDRVAVLYKGSLSLTRWPETSREEIGRLMLGLSNGSANRAAG